MNTSNEDDRIYTCPSLEGCSWQDTNYRDLVLHFQYSHPESFIDTSDSHLAKQHSKNSFYFCIPNTVNYKKNMMMKRLANFFILQFESSAKCQKFWCGVRHIGPKIYVERFFYGIVFFNVQTGKEFCKFGLMQPDTEWIFDKSIMMEFDLNLVKSNSTDFKVRFEIHHYKPSVIAELHKNRTFLLINQIYCQICQNLIISSVYLCPSCHAICEDCQIKSEKSIYGLKSCEYVKDQNKCNLLLEDVTRYLWHYCSNAERGCVFMAKNNAMEKHKLVCPHNEKKERLPQCQLLTRSHNFKCPSLQECYWQGQMKQLASHFQGLHCESYSKEKILSVCVPNDKHYKNIILLESLGGTFLLQFETDLVRNKLWCGVNFVGSNTKAEEFIFCINFFDVTNREINRFGIIKANLDWIFDKDTMMELDLTCVKREANNFKVCLAVNYYNSKAIAQMHTDRLTGRIKCIVCQKQITLGAYLCLSGHLACNTCRRKYTKCEYRQEHKKCNLKLVDVSKYLCIYCDNKERGCNFEGKWKNLKKHQSACRFNGKKQQQSFSQHSSVTDFQKLKCPSLQECNWEGLLKELGLHFQDSHCESYVKGNRVDLDAPIEMNYKRMVLLQSFGSNFLLQFETEVDCKKLWCGVHFIIGQNTRADIFVFRITYHNIDNEETYSYGEMQMGINSIFSKSTMMEFDLNSIKLGASFVKMSIEVMLYNTKTIAEMYKDRLTGKITCFLCQDQITSCAFLCSSGHTTCSICKAKYKKCQYMQDHKECNLKLADVSKYLRHYCDKMEDGCDFKGKWKKLKTHKLVCRFKNQTKPEQLLPQHSPLTDFQKSKCPSLQECNWEGISKELGLHFQESHRESYVKRKDFNLYAPINMNYKKMVLLESFGCNFLLQFEIEVDCKKLWCGVHFIIGNNTKVDSFVFRIVYHNIDNEQIHRYGEMQIGINSIFSKSTMMEFDLNSVKTKASHIKMFIDVLRYNTKTIAQMYIDRLTGKLTCFHCQNQITSCAFLCSSGHTTCNICKAKYKTCEYTKDHNKCNLKLVDVSKYLIHYCGKKEDGCDFKGKWKMLKKHKLVCRFKNQRKYEQIQEQLLPQHSSLTDFQKLKCPSLQECNWQGLLKELGLHFQGSHCESYVKSNKVNLYAPIDMNYKKMVLLQAFGSNFLLQFETEVDCEKLWCGVHFSIGKNTRGDAFVFRLLYHNIDDEEIHSYGEMQMDINSIFCKSSMMEFDLNSVKLGASSVKISIEVMRYNTKTIAEMYIDRLSEKITCFLCKNQITSCAFLCSSCHTTCNICKAKYKKCQYTQDHNKCNLKLVNVSKYLWHYCGKMEDGCNFKGKWKKLENHKLVCRFNNQSKHEQMQEQLLPHHLPLTDFQKLNCPSLQECNWEGMLKELGSHFQNSHVESYAKKKIFSDCVPTDGNYKKLVLLESLGGTFLLQFESDINRNKFWCGVHFVGPDTKVDQFVFRISYFNASNEAISKLGTMQTDIYWTFDKNTMMELDLTYDFRVCLELDDYNSKTIGSAYINQLTGKINCFVCQKHLTTSAFSCASGHAACYSCKAKYTACEYNKCNLKLVNVSGYLCHYCDKKKDGCDFKGKWRMLMEHELACRFKDNNECDQRQEQLLPQHSALTDFQKLKCPSLEECNWEGQLNELGTHFRLLHSETYTKMKTFTFYAPLAEDCKKNMLLENCDGIFLLHYQSNVTSNTFRCGVTYISSNIDVEHLFYGITYVRRNNGKNLSKFKMMQQLNTDWATDKTAMIKVKLNAIKREENQFRLSFHLHYYKAVIIAGIHKKSLLNEITCMACKKSITSFIFLCLAGHTICRDCSGESELKKCVSGRKSKKCNLILKDSTEFIHHYNNKAYRSNSIKKKKELQDPQPSDGLDSDQNQRIYNCPSLEICHWHGTREELSLHFQRSHSTSYTTKNNFDMRIPTNVNYKRNIMFNCLKNIFLLQFESDVRSKKFWCGVRFIGPNTNKDSYFYKLILRMKIYKFGTMQLDTDWTFDKNKMMLFHIDSFKTRNFSVSFELCHYEAKKIADINKKLLDDEVRCALCLKPIMASIYICLTGHAVCNGCTTKSTDKKCEYKGCNLKLKDVSKYFSYYNRNKQYAHLDSLGRNMFATKSKKRRFDSN